MRAQPLFACFLLCSGLLACAETADLCEPGFAQNDAGTCVPSPLDGEVPVDAGADADAGPPEDAGHDAGPPEDSGLDAGPDAGPCNGCEAGFFCSETLSTCLQCDNDTPCTDGLCSEDGLCVACLRNEDCNTDPLTPICNEAGTCVACTGDAECGSDVCATTGECVGCRDEADCVVGEDTFVCNRTTHTCTTNELNDVRDCGTCVADADCRAGRLCVAEMFEGDSLGFRCAIERASGEDCSGQRPYRRLTAAVDIEGGDVSVCMPLSATCQTVIDYLTTECDAPSDCGTTHEDDIALCEDLITGGRNECTYECVDDDDCPTVSADCNTTLGYCEP